MQVFGKNLIEKYKVDIISIGNGTASRESEKLCSELINDNKLIFKNELDYIVHGKSGGELASTILDMSKKPYRIVREGSISKKDILKVVEVL